MEQETNPVRDCKINGCGERARYGMKGYKATRCKEHADGEMIKIKDFRQCRYGECGKGYSYGFVTDEKPSRCAPHALDGMVNTKNDPCEVKPCRTIPIFGILGTNKARVCQKHIKSIEKDGKVVDVRHPSCKTCGDRASYGIKDGNPTYCFTHKDTDNINVVTKKCATIGCGTTPSFGDPEGDRKLLYCYAHKKNYMTNVVNSKCTEKGCGKRPSFNFPDKKAGLRCIDHIETGMVDVRHKLCNYEYTDDGILITCDTRASFGIMDTKKPLRCYAHKDDMVDVVHAKCLTKYCWTPARRDENHKGLCWRCFSLTYPEHEFSKNFKTKERTVSDYIRKSFPDIDIVFDRKIKDGCSSRRPDIFIDMGSHVIVGEIDEGQHNYYDSLCEYNRLVDILEDVGHRPIAVIRFNPDKYEHRYISKDQTEIFPYISCWEMDEHGQHQIIESMKTIFNSKLEKFKESIIYWMKNKPDNIIQTERLFYDEDMYDVALFQFPPK